MDGLHLVTPAKEHAALWRAFISEPGWAEDWFGPGAGLAQKTDYAGELRSIRRYAAGKRLPKGHVPSSRFFLMDGAEEKILGMVDIRHRLNDHLLNQPGGHIGYSVAPSQRRRGYAAEQLRLALLECRKLGIGRALITCSRENEASARTILRCGGVLEDERPDGNGGIFQRYWVPVA